MDDALQAPLGDQEQAQEERDRQAQEAMTQANADLGATLAGETGRGRRRQVSQGQTEAKPGTQGNVGARRASRQRVHADLLTIALRGEMAQRIRRIAQDCNLNLAALLTDMALVYEGQLTGDYEPGTCLRQYRGQEEG